MRNNHVILAHSLNNGSLPIQILLFSLPLMLSNVLQVLFNMADIAVVGRFSGPISLAAVGSTAYAVALFTGILIGLGGGVNALIAYVSAGIIAILLAVSIFLISNTVAIGISVRREEINIMKYIGATDFFVRSPFVVEGILIGLIGAALPLGFIYAIYNVILSYVTERFPQLSELLSFVSVEVVFNMLVPVSLGLGVGIGFLGSMVTVRRHLRV